MPDTPNKDPHGVHQHPRQKLGKRPPAKRRTVDVKDFLKVQEEIPEHPEENPAPPLRYPMNRNDEAGVCVVASCDHALQTVAHHLGFPRPNWTDAQIISYYRTQNPDFRTWADAGGPADQGMYIQVFLEHLVQVGEILAFGKVNHKSPEMLEAATYIGMGVITGSGLQVAQQDQRVWDYKANSPEWGGHAVALVGYSGSPTLHTCATWGRHQQMTNNFIKKCMDEAYLILTPAMINSPHFRNNFDLAGFADALADLTNGKVIVPVPVVPDVPVTPTPAPAPPAPELSDFPWNEMMVWERRGTKNDPAYEKAARRAFRQWRERHGR